MRRKKKKENLLNEIKKEIGFVDGKSFYEIKPRYLTEIFRRVSDVTHWIKNKEIYIIVDTNGNMPCFEVSNYCNIQEIIEYADKYDRYDTLQLYIDMFNNISVTFEDNAYNKYTVKIDLLHIVL